MITRETSQPANIYRVMHCTIALFDAHVILRNSNRVQSREAVISDSYDTTTCVYTK